MNRFNGIDTQRAALLMMHFQPQVFSVLAGVLPKDMIDRANNLIEDWRKTGRPVIFANLALGANFEAVHDNNMLMGSLKKAGLFNESNPKTVLKAAVNDKHYACPRGNIFYGTSLDGDLRVQGIDTLIMAGIASSGVLFSSVGWASDADYQMYLVRECCFDPDTQADEALFRTSFATRAKII